MEGLSSQTLNPMEIPQDLALTIEDFGYLKNSQLAQLTQTNSSYFSAWKSRRSISERKLEQIAQLMGLSKGDLLEAFDAKRSEAQKAKQIREKADRLIQFLKEQGVSA